MSAAALEVTRTDSRVAAFLLVAVFSFALGIFMSLMLAEKPAASPIPPSSSPCPRYCARLILMSHDGGVIEEADPGDCGPAVPSAFEGSGTISLR